MASLERSDGLPVDYEDASFIIELLNGERSDRGMSSSEASDAALGGSIGRDEYEAYARPAEPKEQGVESVFNDGLLDFVSNYRRSEGEKLRLVDEQNLKFATSQVLRKQQMRERGTTGVPDAEGVIGSTSRWSSNSRRDQIPSQRPVKHGREDKDDLENEGYGCEQGREDDERETLTRSLRSTRDSGDHEPATTTMSGGIFRFCSSNSRGADQDPKVSGAANLREEHSGNRRGGKGREVDERSTKMHEGSGRVGPRQALPDGGSTSRRRSKEPRRGTSMTKYYRSSSVKIDVEGSQEPNNSHSQPMSKARTYMKDDETSLPIPSYALPTKHFKNTSRYNANKSGIDAPPEEIVYRWKHQRQAQIGGKTALKLRLEGQRRAIHELEHQANTLREDVRSREEDIKRLRRKLAAMSTSMKQENCSCGASTHHTRLRNGFDSGVAATMSRAQVAEEPMRELESHLAESKIREGKSREKGVPPKCSGSGAQEKTAGLESELASLRVALSEAKRELRQRGKDSQFHVRYPDKLREQEAKGRNVEIARAEAADLGVDLGARLRKMSKELNATRDEAKLLRLEMTQAKARVGDLERENDMLQDRLREASILGKLPQRDRLPTTPKNMTAHSRPRDFSLRNAPLRDSWIFSEPSGKSPLSLRLPNATGSGGRGSETKGLQVEHPPRRPCIRESSQSQPETSKFARVCGARLRRSSRRSHFGEDLPDSSSTSESPKTLRELSYVQGSAAHRVSTRKDDSRTGDEPRTVGRQSEQACHRSNSRTDCTNGGYSDAERMVVTLRKTSPECSTISAGSNRTSMKERYEKLRAMYKKVNQRDTRIRGRAGVG